MRSKRSGLVAYVILYVFLVAFFSLGRRVDLFSLTIPLAFIAFIAVVVLLLTGDWR